LQRCGKSDKEIEAARKLDKSYEVVSRKYANSDRQRSGKLTSGKLTSNKLPSARTIIYLASLSSALIIKLIKAKSKLDDL
jgi:hypothetical protein